MFHYRAHGLAVAANRPIVELLEDRHASDPQVTILFGEQPGDVVSGHDETTWFTSSHVTADGRPALIATKRQDGASFRLTYADGPSFLIDARGSTIRVSWPGALTMAATLSYLLGPVFGIVMRLRGIACLHASAVELDGKAHVFAGPEGSGKSTLVAAFAHAGERVLSDDIVTVTRRGAAFMTAPAYPRVRLWPDAMAALHADDRDAPSGGTAAHATRQHLDLRVGDRFARESAPIAAIYFLEYDDAPGPWIETLAPADALPRLAASTFAHRALDREGRIGEFHMVADLVRTVPMRRIVRPPGLERIAATRAAVVDVLCVCGPAGTSQT